MVVQVSNGEITASRRRSAFRFSGYRVFLKREPSFGKKVVPWKQMHVMQKIQDIYVVPASNSIVWNTLGWRVLFVINVVKVTTRDTTFFGILNPPKHFPYQFQKKAIFWSKWTLLGLFNPFGLWAKNGYKGKPWNKTGKQVITQARKPIRSQNFHRKSHYWVLSSYKLWCLC